LCDKGDAMHDHNPDMQHDHPTEASRSHGDGAELPQSLRTAIRDAHRRSPPDADALDRAVFEAAAPELERLRRLRERSDPLPRWRHRRVLTTVGSVAALAAAVAIVAPLVLTPTSAPPAQRSSATGDIAMDTAPPSPDAAAPARTRSDNASPSDAESFADHADAQPIRADALSDSRRAAPEPLASAAPRDAAAAASDPLDTNDDGAVDVLDAFLAARVLESAAAEGASAPERFDVNRDGAVDRLDIELILDAAVRLSHIRPHQHGPRFGSLHLTTPHRMTERLS
jgi:hypothetical protein